MAKAAKHQLSSSQSSANRKLTDFFARKPSGASLSQPGSSQQTASTNTQPPSGLKARSASKKTAESSLSTTIRIPKKESAPPRADQDVISISSRSDTATHISISSEGSVISITSSSYCSSPPPIPIAILQVESTAGMGQRARESMRLQAPAAATPLRRKSPRLNAVPAQMVKKELLAEKFTVKASTKRTKTSSKTKKRKNAFEDDDDELDLVDAEEAIVIQSKPKIKLEKEIVDIAKAVDRVTPRSLSHKPPSPKKIKLEASAEEDSPSEEVIPSSQSDEEELTLLKRKRKDTRDIEENVKAWQKESQDTVLHDEGTDGNYDTAYEDDADFGSTVDIGVELDTGETTHLSSPSPPMTPPSSSLPPLTPTPPKKLLSKPPDAEHLPVSKTLSSRTSPLYPPTPFTPKSYTSPTRTPRSCHPIQPASPKTSALTTSPNPWSSASSLTKVPGTPSPSISVGKDEIHLPKTPAALDEKSKTVAIIEQIKAQAFATISSPEPDECVFGELEALSDSSESEDGHFLANLKGKAPAIASSSRSKARASSSRTVGEDGLSSLANLDESAHRRTRSSVKTSASGSSSSSTAGSVRRRKSSRKSDAHNPGNIPVTLTQDLPSNSNLKRRKNHGGVPFAALLKEKARDVKLGTTALPSYVEGDTEVALVFRSNLGLSSSSSSSSEQGDLENVVEADTMRLLGDDQGRRVGKIIDTDKKGRVGKLVEEKLVGVPLWVVGSSSDRMQVDASWRDRLAPLKASGGCAVVDILKKYVERQDVTGLIALLQSGAIATNTISWTTPILLWLFDTAVSVDEPVLAQHAFRTLLHRSTPTAPNTSTILPFSSLLRALVRLGAQTNVIESLGWEVSSQMNGNVDERRRADALYRFIAIVDSFAAAKELNSDDVPDFVVALLLIALDPSTGPDTRNDVIVAVERLCNSFCSVITGSRGSLEMRICAQVFRLTPSLSPANKVHLVSFLPGGSPLVRRIAQWIAFMMLDSEASASLLDSSILAPPLSSIIALLSPQSNTGSTTDLPGPLEIRKQYDQPDLTDYEALSFHVEILSVTLTNIPVYVEMENQERLLETRSKTVNDGPSDVIPSPSRKTPRAQQKLEIVQDSLQLLGSKIVDTRGAHLDRSRAKAAIQRLAMRIHYQRLAALRSGPGSGRPRIKKLSAYFAPQTPIKANASSDVFT